MRGLINIIVILAGVAALLLWMFVAIGCSSTKSGGGLQIIAEHSVPELTDALRSAEAKLGRKFRGQKIWVTFKPGEVYNKKGYWTLKSGLGGATYRNHVTIYTNPKTGKATPLAMEHEMAHVVLGIGNEAEDHEIMRKAGFVW